MKGNTNESIILCKIVIDDPSIQIIVRYCIMIIDCKKKEKNPRLIDWFGAALQLDRKKNSAQHGKFLTKNSKTYSTWKFNLCTISTLCVSTWLNYGWDICCVKYDAFGHLHTSNQVLHRIFYKKHLEPYAFLLTVKI